MPPLNEKIEKLSKEKRDEMIRPVAAFLTFERQEGKDRALKYFADEKNVRKVEAIDDNGDIRPNDDETALIQDLDRDMLGVDIICYSACEPSDIVWENRHVTVRERNIRKVGALIVIIIFMILMFFLLVGMKSIETTNMYRYPATINCDAIADVFSGTNADLWLEYATLDKDYTIAKQGTGTYQCYCEQMGLAALAADKNSICSTYFNQYLGGEALGELVTVVITVVNILIRTLCIFLITRIGYWTVTAEISAVAVSVYVTTFFNTGILLLLADADLSQIAWLSWVPFVQNGPFPDLTEEWYIVIAPSLILTMVLNALSPPIEIATYWITGIITKTLD